MVIEAHQLFLPKPPFFSPSFPFPPPHFSSFLFHPLTFSFALFHSDSSISLYPNFSPFSSTLPPPQITVPPPISAATFLLLRNPNPNPNTTLFLISSPISGGASVLLRFYILNTSRKTFTPARVVTNHSDLNFDESKLGVVFRVSHGVSVKLIGDVNVFALYSILNGKVWVFAVKQLGNEEVKLMKCAVIDCTLPVFSISVSFGYLILGEENGVRVYPLRPLVKGRAVKKEKGGNKKSLEKDTVEVKKASLRNGVILNGINAEICSIGVSDERIENRVESAKLRSVRLRQDSRDSIANFVAFKSKDDDFESIKMPAKSAKAIAIQALCSTKFLILDSEGNLNLLYLATSVHGSETPYHMKQSVHGSETPYHMKQLTHNMKVRKFVVLPDSSTRSQTVWMSDALHTVQMMVVTDMDSSVSQTDSKDPVEKLVQTSVVQAIFSCEKIQEIAALAANTILLLGQGSMFAYAIS